MSHTYYLNLALELAAKRRGFCAPNPAVGAILVKNGKSIGQGYHFAAGQPHAEINALQQAGNNAQGATLYVTLEPCCHHGRTPPCTEALINAGIKQVFFSFKDPNPLVANKSAQQLKNANIGSTHIPLKSADHFYRSYRHWLQHKKPWITIKLAISEDSKIAQQDGKPAVITSTPANFFTHQQRLKSDAILTSINTILSDNPQLNARTNDQSIAKPLYLLDTECKLPPDARIHTSTKLLTTFHKSTFTPSPPCRSFSISTDQYGLSLKEIITQIGKDGMHDLWVEAGPKTFTAFIFQALADEIILYQGAVRLGIHAKPFNFPLEKILCNYKELEQVYLGPDLKRHFIKNNYPPPGLTAQQKPAKFAPISLRGGVQLPTGGKCPAQARERLAQIWCDSRADGHSPDGRRFRQFYNSF